MTYRYTGTLALVISLSASWQAFAQLPANPWAAVPQSDSVAEQTATLNQTQDVAGANVGHITAPKESNPFYIPSPKYAPINADATAPVYRPAISDPVNSAAQNQPAARALGNATGGYALQRQTATVSAAKDSWRGSGKYGNQNYTGSVTTYGRAYGQEMLAPEVNNNNMNIMVQKLRDLGYRIPASYDNGFTNFLSTYTNDLERAYGGLGRQNNPADTVFNGILDSFEHFTGLDAGNLMFNSIDLIKRD